MCVVVAVDYASFDGAQLPAQARSIIASELVGLLSVGTGRESLVHAAQLAVSELVTNSVNAGASRISTRMTVHRDHVRVAVEDDAEGAPRPRQAGPSDSNGRGLAILASLGRSWGIEQLPSGKQVWVDLPVDAHLAASVACHIANDANAVAG
ncbi:MAG: ATP-binding protein [Actinomycetota bacterium]|nr:ATP-binding protein [Actinomycetota bacterium]